MISREDSQRIKGMAILLLLFHHLFWDENLITNTGMEMSSETIGLITPVGRAARICVWMFAFVSAYGLTRKYLNLRQQNGKFFWDSWVSLMHRYWIYVLLAIVLCFFFGRNPWDFYEHSLGKAVLDFFAWSDFFHLPRLSGAWWYMCFAQIVILLIPLLTVLSEKVGILAIPMMYLLRFYVGSSEIRSTAGGAYTSYLMILMIGVFCARNPFPVDWLRGQLTSWRKRVGMITACAVALAGVLIVRHHFMMSGNDVFYLGDLFATVGACLAIAIILMCPVIRGGRCVAAAIGQILLWHVYDPLLFVHRSSKIYVLEQGAGSDLSDGHRFKLSDFGICRVDFG